MPANENGKRTEEDKLFSGILLLNSRILGLVLGTVLGLVVFVATNWLVLKGGTDVGRHLQLLGQYFIGYRVSFFGSFIGFLYGFAFGTMTGSFIGWFYNKIAAFRKPSENQ